MTGLWERYLDNGALITFEERETGYRAYHYQPVEGKRVRLPSVTSVLGVLSKDALVRWAEEQGVRGAVEALRRGELATNADPDDAVRVVRDLRLGADAARDRAAGRGLDIHGILERYSLKGEVPNPADYPAEHAGYIQGLVRAILHLDPEAIAIEQLVADADMGVAGRYDLRARIGGRDLLCDLKTSAKGRIYETAHAQLCFYSMLAQWCGEPEPDGLLLIAVAEDGRFTTQECFATPEHCRAILACYEAMKTIRAPLDAIARTERKAAEQERLAA